MHTTKILILVAMWKRPEITEICLMGIERLRKIDKISIDVLAVISEADKKPLCEKYGVDWVWHENLPLGKKKNFGVQEALKRDFDYMVEIGSDDLLFNEIFDLYDPLFKRGIEYIGINDILVLDSESGKCNRWRYPHSPYGIGRAIKKSALLKVGSLWRDDVNRGLDGVSIVRMAKVGVRKYSVDNNNPLAIDIKGQDNIWPFTEGQGRPYDFDMVRDKLSPQELEAIDALVCCPQN